MSNKTIRSQVLSECFYTTDTYQTFSTELLSDSWFDESDFDNDTFMEGLGELHAEAINYGIYDGPVKGVKFVDTRSPREYNFQTDQVILDIEVDMDELYDYAHKNEKELDEFLHERFTSYDGYWSFLPNNIKDFFGAINRTSEEYNTDGDHDSCVAVLVGFYLTRESLPVQEYMEYMYDKIHELLWNNFIQFTSETWDEYNKYTEEFEKLKSQTVLTLDGIYGGDKYPMDIEEWFKATKGNE